MVSSLPTSRIGFSNPATPVKEKCYFEGFKMNENSKIFDKISVKFWMSIEKVDSCGAVLFMLTEFASLFVSLSCENCAVHDFDMEGQRRHSISGQIMQWWNYLLAIHLNNSLITPAQPFPALQSQIVRISFLKCRSKAAPKHFADSDLNRNQFCSRTRAVDCRWR